MLIVVTHLTRMDPGYICVAGIEPRSGRHIRPQADDRLSVRKLRRHHGPIDLGCLVELGATRPSGRPPYVEDHAFNPRYARRLRDLEAPAFWELLERATQPSLHAIFGPALQRRGRTYTVEVGAGSASLGCLRPASIGFEEDRTLKKIRLVLGLGDIAPPVSLSLTDLRYCQPDHQTPRWETVDRVQARLRAGVPALVCVGLTRPWKKLGDPVSQHWLQANNLHLADDPLWQERLC